VTTGSLYPAQRVARHLGYGRRMIRPRTQQTFTEREFGRYPAYAVSGRRPGGAGESAHGPVLRVLIAPSFLPSPGRSRRRRGPGGSGASRTPAAGVESSYARAVRLERDSRRSPRGALDLVGVEHLAGGHFQPEAARLEVVRDEVAGDGHQPAPKSRPCQVKVPMRRRARRKVSLGGPRRWLASHSVVDVPVHSVRCTGRTDARKASARRLARSTRSIMRRCRCPARTAAVAAPSSALVCRPQRGRRPVRSTDRRVRRWRRRGRRTRWGRSRATGPGPLRAA